MQSNDYTMQRLGPDCYMTYDDGTENVMVHVMFEVTAKVTYFGTIYQAKTFDLKAISLEDPVNERIVKGILLWMIETRRELDSLLQSRGGVMPTCPPELRGPAQWLIHNRLVGKF